MTKYKLAVSRAKDAHFEGGLRDVFVYRDLAVGAATGGAFGAHVIRAVKPCEGVTGRHRHGLGFQIWSTSCRDTAASGTRVKAR